ncbi:hypothetical protein J2S50_000046 [Streptomyces sp. DSM 40167]|nr:hypothetical protein [Streptomyces sp. DSM 40167]
MAVQVLGHCVLGGRGVDGDDQGWMVVHGDVGACRAATAPRSPTQRPLISPRASVPGPVLTSAPEEAVGHGAVSGVTGATVVMPGVGRADGHLAYPGGPHRMAGRSRAPRPRRGDDGDREGLDRPASDPDSAVRSPERPEMCRTGLCSPRVRVMNEILFLPAFQQSPAWT